MKPKDHPGDKATETTAFCGNDVLKDSLAQLLKVFNTEIPAQASFVGFTLTGHVCIKLQYRLLNLQYLIH